MDSSSAMPVFLEVVLFVLGVPMCIVWLVFPFILMKRMGKILEETEKSNRLLSDALDADPVPFSSFPKVSIVPKAKIISPVVGTPPPPSVVPLKVSKGGRVHGLKDTCSIKIMLKKGELTLQDRYFDKDKNEWATLDSHPEIGEVSPNSQLG